MEAPKKLTTTCSCCNQLNIKGTEFWIKVKPDGTYHDWVYCNDCHAKFYPDGTTDAPWYRYHDEPELGACTNCIGSPSQMEGLAAWVKENNLLKNEMEK
tara:strand:+ start:381 stop:677 length:297 start_codon:yes stop_codon:yes gene_type:complete